MNKAFRLAWCVHRNCSPPGELMVPNNSLPGPMTLVIPKPRRRLLPNGTGKRFYLMWSGSFASFNRMSLLQGFQPPVKEVTVTIPLLLFLLMKHLPQQQILNAFLNN